MYGEQVAGAVRHMMYRVFGWMTIALCITAGISYYVASRALFLETLHAHPWYFWGVLLAQLVVAVVFSAMLPRLSYGSALILFLMYSVLAGLTLSVIFYAYYMDSIIRAFLIAAGMFGSMALYGYVTQSDLTRMGYYLYMALWGIILSVLINIFFRSSHVDFLISCITVVVFSGLTAYDVFVVRQYAVTANPSDKDAYGKMGLYGAFRLYLDFVNIFLALLRITGKKRD